MSTDPYSNREIQLMFKNIEVLLVDIKKDIANTNISFDVRFKEVDKELDAVKLDVKELQKFQTRALAYWSVAVVLVGWVINNFAKFVL